MKKILLYHTAYQEIREPDIYYGRKNADFGQGFYLTPDKGFAGRWAKERKGSDIIINTYELVTEGLQVKLFERDEQWYDYIYCNRNRQEDYLGEYDLICGPVANDTIYDVMGIITSGMLSTEEAFSLLKIGPEYIQVAIKSQKALSRLHWISSVTEAHDDLEKYKLLVRAEEMKYQDMFAAALEEMAVQEGEI